MNFIELAKANLIKLPDLRKFGYYAGDFFFNFYGDEEPIRVGCVYSDRSLGEFERENKRYLFLKEIFKKNPCLEFLEKDGNFLFGYVPKFPQAENCANSGFPFFSFQKNDKVITVFNLKREIKHEIIAELPSFFDSKNDKNLKEFFSLLNNCKDEIGSLPIFDFLDFFPSEVNEWRLVTVFAGYSAVEVENILHVVSNLQGNYKKNSEYLNLIFQFVYKFSEGKVNIAPKGEVVKLNGKEIFVEKVGFITNFSYFDKKENFVIKVSNNITTRNSEKYVEDMRDLLFSAIKNLENYSCEKATKSFVEYLRGLK